MCDREALEKLLAYQIELKSEEECLKGIINKLNEQAHALQVEQLHILNAINKNAQTSENASATPHTSNINLKTESVDLESQELDLTVTNYQSSEEDEDEMDD